MKKNIIVTTALAALFTSSFAQAGLLGQSQQSLQTSSTAISQASQWSADSITVASQDSGEALSLVGQWIVAGFHASERGSVVVLTSAEQSATTASQAISRESQRVFTASGRILKGSVTKSETAIHCSEDLAREASEASSRVSNETETVVVRVYTNAKKAVVGSSETSSDKIKEFFVGSVEMSGRAARELSEDIKSGAKALVEESGTLITKSADGTSKVVGQVFEISKTGSKEAVKFVSREGGRLVHFSEEKAAASLHFSGDVMKALIGDSKTAASASGRAITVSVEDLGAAVGYLLTASVTASQDASASSQAEIRRIVVLNQKLHEEKVGNLAPLNDQN